MPLPAKYDSAASEKRWYDYWMEKGYFNSTPDEREPYCIVIPPPNVTGVLHMGHMLNNTLQDVLVRRARALGKNACWVPGTDHASIATEAKVVAALKERGIEKADLTKDEFLEHAWEWTHKHGGIILEQLKRLGASCDWERTKFTLDPDLSKSVTHVFVDLYNKGLIYRGHRMVNWDPEAQTTLSDEEVIHEERAGHLYHLQYKLVDSDETLTIATTRPETILGDTAICVHPDDERYTHLVGKKAIVPLVEREIPIIADAYVDMEFGTGALKVTPAHDMNDRDLGIKHDLEIIDIFNADGTLNSNGLHYDGKDRFVVRKQISKELEEKGYLIEKEPHKHKVGLSERTKAVIEPRLSDQWFLKMKDLAQPALDAVIDGDVALVPPKFINTYRHWMENVRDWNISRQLWWGHEIPAYYYGNGKEDFVVASTREEALTLARKKSNNDALTADQLRQDEDALDTWFSSWLWPISVFNGILEPDNEDINYYYPTNDLVTAPEILFFWVARMIIAGYEYRGEKPFQSVYLTGIVRDKQRRKMSKSLGNSPDPLDLIAKYSADGVRVGMLLSSPAGNDLMFDEALCKQGSGFINKIWNSYRLVQGWEVVDGATSAGDQLAIDWYRSRMAQAMEQLEDHYNKYRLSDALMVTYKLIWDDYCSWFLELVKPEYQTPIHRDTYKQVIAIFEDNLKLLHPFIPFVTEELWQDIADRQDDQALCVSLWPEQPQIDATLLSEFAMVQEVISGVRNVRKDKQISFRDSVSLFQINHENLDSRYDVIIQKLGNTTEIQSVNEAPAGAVAFRAGSNEYFIPVASNVNAEDERAKIEEELKYTEGFLNSVRKKLSNERFVSGAPEKVVALEKQKEADAVSKVETLKAALANLS